MTTGTLDLLAGPICAIRIGLGALLLRTAAGHARDMRGFGDIVIGYRLMPEGMAVYAAAVLAALEFVCGLALLAAIFVPGVALAGGLLTATLFCVFAFAMAINLRRGRSILCGCGDDSAPLSWAGLVQTAILAPLALIAALPVGSQPPTLLIQAAGGGVLLLMLYDAMRRLVQQQRGGIR